MDFSLSYREIIPNNIVEDDWIDVEINTGTQHTLQDIKSSEKSGAFCYGNTKNVLRQNRFIYWRARQDVLELTEVSLNYTLKKNKLRLRFTDTTVLAVELIENAKSVSLLITTVSSLHRFNFACVSPEDIGKPSTLSGTVTSATLVSSTDVECRGSQPDTASSSSSTTDSNSLLYSNQLNTTYSIFRNVNSASILEDACQYHIDGHVAAAAAAQQQQMHSAAACYMQSDSDLAYFSVSQQTKLMLYIMNTNTGMVKAHEVNHQHLIPHFLSSLKGALIGNKEPQNYAISLAFCNLKEKIYLVVLHSNKELRLWCTTTLQQICTKHCIRNVDGGGHGANYTSGPQQATTTQSSMRKINDHKFCIYFSHLDNAEFAIIDIKEKEVVAAAAATEPNSYYFVYHKSISAPQFDLTDFCASTTRIWALWSNAQGVFSVSSYALEHGVSYNWISAALEPPPDRYSLTLQQGVDPREAYCSYIFQPGKFDRYVISKALQMFRSVHLPFDLKNFNMSVLKEQVCQAVEEEIQNEMKEFVISDEEYLEIATRLWERFYLGCEQYHLKYAEPTGIVLLNTIDAICIVRKQSFSFLRPCEMLEHLMLAGDFVDEKVVLERYFFENVKIGKDFIKLMSVLAQIEKWLPEEIKIDIDRKMYQLEKPAVLITQLAKEIFSGSAQNNIFPNNFTVVLQQRLAHIKNFCGAVELLHDAVRMDNIEAQEGQNYTQLFHSTKAFLQIGSLFGSEYGLSILTETVKQNAILKFALCRNLLLLEQLIGDTFFVNIDEMEKISNNIMPDTVIFLQAYYIMVWIAETPVSLSAPATLETSIQRLSLVRSKNDVNRIYFSYTKQSGNTTLLHLFLQTKGLLSALSRFVASPKYVQRSDLNSTLLPLVHYVNKLLWVVSYDFVFGEWLMGTCQHVIIQDYTRLLSTWCEWNICSRQFILAVSLLDCDQMQKAYRLFIKCARGVLKEKFLFDYVLVNTPLYKQLEKTIGPLMNTITHSVDISNKVVALYYLKVIQLFEHHQALDYIISLATIAKEMLAKDDEHLPVFQSIVFSNHLVMHHFTEAYDSLISNVDKARRRDSLRQLVIALFDERRQDLLIKYPYAGLSDEFERIVESRARALTMDNNEAYNFLYSYYATAENMRKASTVMYEQAMRYKIEYSVPHALQKRCNCLLSCVNTMVLTDDRYRWIVKPVLDEEEEALLPICDEGSEPQQAEAEIQHKVDVLTLEDLHRELVLAQCLVELSQHRTDVQTYINASAEELSYLLTSDNLFTTALRLAKSSKLSVLPIFDSLTVACVRSNDEKDADTWTWLQENKLGDLPQCKKASQMAWSLLEKLINEHEEPESTTIKKCVVHKILLLNAFVPQWLENSYKESNCPEILRTYVQHDRLMEAHDIAIDMIKAMLGEGVEYFSFKNALNVHNPPMMFPVNTINVLLLKLEINGREYSQYKVAYLKLEESVKKYANAVESVSKHKLQLALKGA